MTADEVIPSDLAIIVNSSNSNYNIGRIYALAVTKNALFISTGSSGYGEWARIKYDGTVEWAVNYGSWGVTLTISEDESFLIGGGERARFYKINALTGQLIGAYKQGNFANNSPDLI